jgi:hypothetical protein
MSASSTAYLMGFITGVLISVVFVYLIFFHHYTLEDAMPTLGDPHQNDENYCGVYQATLNWNNVPYVVNFNVAEKVCTCTSKTLPSNSTWYSCERRS